MAEQNRAPEEQVKRFTPTMWALLRYTAKHCPKAKIGGPWLRSARVLERRGFIIVCRCVGGCYSMRLTPAGAEAIALSSRDEAPAMSHIAPATEVGATASSQTRMNLIGLGRQPEILN